MIRGVCLFPPWISCFSLLPDICFHQLGYSIKYHGRYPKRQILMLSSSSAIAFVRVFSGVPFKHGVFQVSDPEVSKHGPGYTVVNVSLTLSFGITCERWLLYYKAFTLYLWCCLIRRSSSKRADRAHQGVGVSA